MVTNRSRAFLTAFSLIYGVGVAQAGTLPAPKLQRGHYVYTIPEGWVPPGFSQEKLDDLNHVAAALHKPFYVVFVQALPGPSDRDADAAIDGLPEDWSLQPDYNLPESSVFLLSFAPRKYRMLAGPAWKNQFGLEKSALVQFHDNFKRAVSGTPKNPFGGITETMRSFDDYVWNLVDPVRVAARQAEAKRREIEHKRDLFRAALSPPLTAMASYLENPEYLPSNANDMRALYGQAKKAYEGEDTDAMEKMTKALTEMNAKVGPGIEAKRQAAADAALYFWLKFLFILAVIITAGIFYFVRKRAYDTLKMEFDAEAEKWGQMVGNALIKYTTSFKKRDDIIGLKGATGKTKKLYDETTATVNEIYSSIRGLEAHVKNCVGKALTASIFNLQPMRDAKDDLEGSFQFDTGKMNDDELFEGETKVITVRASKFAAEQLAIFKKCQANWTRLQEAASMRFDEKAYNGLLTDRDGLLKEITTAGIPERWMSDHPLFGDLYQKVITGLKEEAKTDPLSIAEKVDALKEAHVAIAQRCTLLIKAMGNAAAAKNEKVQDVGDAVLDPDDDPNVPKQEALVQETVVAGALASTDINHPGLVEAEIKLLTKLRLETVKRAAAVASAMKKLDRSKMEQAKQASSDTIERAAQCVSDAEKVHARNTMERAYGLLSSARSRYQRGCQDTRNLTEDQAKKKYLVVGRNLANAIVNFETAEGEAQRCIAECRVLDEKKVQFEQRQTEMERQRRTYQEKIHGYGHSHVQVTQQPIIVQNNTSNDYLALLALQEAQESRWRAQEAEARRDYERRQEDARREERRAAEARAEAERAAEASRQRSYHSSSSSSSSSSWDSGSSSSSGSSWDSGSSSSGGDFSGGGSSSSGGDW